jgi:hypothetical protein
VVFWPIFGGKKMAGNQVFHRGNWSKHRAKKEMKLALENTHIVTVVASPKKVTLSCIKHASHS